MAAARLCILFTAAALQTSWAFRAAVHNWDALPPDWQVKPVQEDKFDAEWCKDFPLKEGCTALRMKACPVTCDALYNGDKEVCHRSMYNPWTPGMACTKVQRKQCPHRCLCIAISPDQSTCEPLEELLCAEECGDKTVAPAVVKHFARDTLEIPSEPASDDKPEPAWCKDLTKCMTAQRRMCPNTCAKLG